MTGIYGFYSSQKKYRDGSLFHEAWVWTGGTRRFILPRLTGLTLHACCGKSQIGDIRFDLDPSTEPQIIADALHPPFRENIFDTIVCDPPWDLRISLRHKLSFAFHNLLNHGGKLLLRAPWFPQVRGLELIELYVQGMNTPYKTNTVLLATCQKKDAQLSEWM